MIDANQIAGLRYVTLGADLRTSRSKCFPGLQDGEKLIAAPGNPRIRRQTNRGATMSDSFSNPNARQRHALRLAGRIAHVFIQSKLTPLVIVGRSLLGAFSILQTPREEEPQIVVPDAGCFRPDARSVGRRSDAARDRADGKTAARNSRRRVRLLHQPSRPEHADRALLRGHEGRRRDRPDVQQALFQF